MADYYLETSFKLGVTRDEAEIFKEVINVLTEMDGTCVLEIEEPLYAKCSDAFKEIFPKGDNMPFDNLRAIDDYNEHINISFDVDYEDSNDGALIYISGNQVEIQIIANIIWHICKSALPFGFTYSYSCSSPRIGEFGGGYCVIDDNGADFFSTRELMVDGIAGVHCANTPLYVLSAFNFDEAFFWNEETGFTSLSEATIFTEREAKQFDKSIFNYETKWMTLPKCHNEEALS